jgi:L-asparagine transporter-like permease
MIKIPTRSSIRGNNESISFPSFHRRFNLFYLFQFLSYISLASVNAFNEECRKGHLIIFIIYQKNKRTWQSTAAGVMLILNWIIILSSQIKLRKQQQRHDLFQMAGYPATSYIGIVLILITVSGGLLHSTQRMGVFISLGFIVLIFISHRVIFRQPRNITSIRKIREE